MQHSELVKASIEAKRIGWYATRQNLAKRGATRREISRVLAWQLEILGADERRGSDHYMTQLRDACVGLPAEVISRG